RSFAPREHGTTLDRTIRFKEGALGLGFSRVGNRKLRHTYLYLQYHGSLGTPLPSLARDQMRALGLAVLHFGRPRSKLNLQVQESKKKLADVRDRIMCNLLRRDR